MLGSFKRIGSQFTSNQRASALVEFAFGLPLLLMIYAGISELAQATGEWRKLVLLSRTMADLTAQGDTQNPISSATMNDIVGAAAKIMRPFDVTSLKVVVSAMGVDLSQYGQNPRVCSSFASSTASARTVGTATNLTVPAGYQTTGLRYVFVEASITYKPMLGSALIKIIPGIQNPGLLTSTTYWPVRGGKKYGTNTYFEIVLPGAGFKACDGSVP